ncbi:MAG: asparagine synthase [Rhodocyclaceae bacterium]|nr:asparagine synthase [Rhodocyclaceae bacterium]
MMPARGDASPIDLGITDPPADAGVRLEVGPMRLLVGSESSFSRRGERCCVALGEPDFRDPELQRIAQHEGAASAWLRYFADAGAVQAAKVGGRFSVVFLDGERNTATLAVDRFATYPLCYSLQDGQLAFAARADEVPVRNRCIDLQSIYDYLYFHVIPSPATIFRDVRRLQPGHWLRWQNGKEELRRYWQADFQPDPAIDLASAKRQFLEIVENSVTRAAKSPRTGAFLSGGTDSSTVSGMLCKALGKPAPTYSIGFDAAGYDEMAFARIAAKRFGTDHHEYYVRPEDLLEGIPEVAGHYDQPFGNSSAVPAWLCARNAAADGVTRLLAGDGGDELFGGNARYAKQRIFGVYDLVPAALRHGLLEPVLAAPGADRIPLLRKGASYVRQAKVPMPDRLGMYNLLTRLQPGRILGAALLAEVSEASPLQLQRKEWEHSAGHDLLNRMLAFDLKFTLADNDLPKVIGTTSLAGVDVGFPLLSDELLDFSLQLPPRWKLKGLTLRWFFKEALRGFLPDEILAKKKHGFGLPFGVWTVKHDGLKTMARDSLTSLAQRGIVRQDFVDELLNEHMPQHPGYYGEMVWIMQTLEIWLARHAPGFGL